jgi:hypothetical protein
MESNAKAGPPSGFADKFEIYLEQVEQRRDDKDLRGGNELARLPGGTPGRARETRALPSRNVKEPLRHGASARQAAGDVPR